VPKMYHIVIILV